MTKRNGPASAGDAQAGLIWAPALTPLELAERERLVEPLMSGSGSLVMGRRAGLHVLTRTPAELQAAWATDEGMDAMTDALELVMFWRDYLTEAAELADLALDRLAATAKTAVKAAKLATKAGKAVQ